MSPSRRASIPQQRVWKCAKALIRQSRLGRPDGSTQADFPRGNRSSRTAERTPATDISIQSGKLDEILEQKPTGPTGNDMKGHAALIEPSKFDRSQSKFSYQRGNHFTCFGIIARYEYGLSLPRRVRICPELCCRQVIEGFDYASHCDPVLGVSGMPRPWLSVHSPGHSIEFSAIPQNHADRIELNLRSAGMGSHHWRPFCRSVFLRDRGRGRGRLLSRHLSSAQGSGRSASTPPFSRGRS
jgi:hypothetical protein